MAIEENGETSSGVASPKFLWVQKCLPLVEQQ